jgi:putative oxidoreductase
MIRRLLFHSESYSSMALNGSLLFLRLGLGLIMAFVHGLKKIPPQEQFIGLLAKLGFPMPELFAWLAGLSELLGGLFIAIGLATRFSSASLVITMGVAAFMAHAGDPWKSKELAIIFLISFVFIFLAGPGKYSVDSMIIKK